MHPQTTSNGGTAQKKRSFLFKALAAALVIGLAVIARIVVSSKAEERQRINLAALSPNGLYLAATGLWLGCS